MNKFMLFLLTAFIFSGCKKDNEMSGNLLYKLETICEGCDMTTLEFVYNDKDQLVGLRYQGSEIRETFQYNGQGYVEYSTLTLNNMSESDSDDRNHFFTLKYKHILDDEGRLLKQECVEFDPENFYYDVLYNYVLSNELPIQYQFVYLSDLSDFNKKQTVSFEFRGNNPIGSAREYEYKVQDKSLIVTHPVSYTYDDKYNPFYIIFQKIGYLPMLLNSIVSGFSENNVLSSTFGPKSYSNMELSHKVPNHSYINSTYSYQYNAEGFPISIERSDDFPNSRPITFRLYYR